MSRVRKRPPRPRLEEGDELGVDWEKWSDGRAWRLKRKRDFGDVDPALARAAAATAAERMGKVVQTIRDRQFPEKYTWVQFADYRIKVGEPCPCGSRKLYRLHTYFARCPQCNAQLILDPAIESPHAVLLRELTDVHLARIERSGNTSELYGGYAQKDGEPVLVLAEFRAEPDEELDPEQAVERVQKVRFVPFRQLSVLLDVSALWDRRDADWDLVL